MNRAKYRLHSLGRWTITAGITLMSFATSADAGPRQTDFNGDGLADLAVGVPADDVDGVRGAGSVSVFYGTSAGVSGPGSELWHQDRAGVFGVVEPGDGLGQAVAVGDFDGDGFSDLAIGAPGENLDLPPAAGGMVVDGGMVNVLYGSAAGLEASGNQIWHQGIDEVAGTAVEGDRFGYALTAGDFDGDGRDDLAVGSPFESVDGADRAGSVNVIYGSPAGLTATGNQLWSQSGAVRGRPEAGDFFGAALVAGDFDDDGFEDLAIGVPHEDVGGVPDRGIRDGGMVNVLYGSASGLTADRNQIWHQARSGVLGAVEPGDWFGSALGVGDFDDDGVDDLAVGIALEDLGDVVDGGAAMIFYGSAGVGLTSAGNQFFAQDTAEVPGAAGIDECFGAALSVGDFDDDGVSDLAVGVPHDVVNRRFAGSVNVLFGSSTGLTATDSELWSQASDDIVGNTERFDRFGSALAAGDFDGDGASDLVVGVSGEDITIPVNGENDTLGNAGLIHVLFGSTSGLTSIGSQDFTRGSDGVGGDLSASDWFGFALR